MKPVATITLASHGLELRCAAANIREDRPLTENDLALLTEWGRRYANAASSARHEDELLEIGREFHDWLDGADRFLERMIDSVAAPVLIEFAAGRSESEQVRAFLDAPWELLASDGRHWALREFVFTPVRRIGKAQESPALDSHGLRIVFMAAAPRGATPLDYQAEEASILEATKNIGLDLVVEESGTLALLAACVAREKPDVVQISCHGTLEPSPALLLEDDFGDKDLVAATQIVSRLGSQHVRLLFLSACETAEAHPVLDSLARALVRAGAPAVLGWAGPVLDREATLFASLLHERLAGGEDLAHAIAYARHDLTQSEQLPDAPPGVSRARDWHLARLYLGPHGGGALATAGGPRRFVDRGHALKTFLDAKGQVPVAGELEFVGRRREIQSILRAFRASGAERPCGVLVHGVGRQGKSSLAARVAHRMEPTHETVVLYGRYDAPAVLAAFRDRLATGAVTEIVDRHLPRVESEPASLLAALNELLEGPCEQNRMEGNERCRPVLLVIDDFEQALEEQQNLPHRVRSESIDAMRAVLLAFSAARTESRLLVTSRVEFTLPHNGTDLATRLFDLPLRGMNERDAHKQAVAKIRAHPEMGRAKNLDALLDRLGRIIPAARGNAGLQDVLFSLCLEDPQACDRCLEQMEEYGRSGTAPSEDAVRKHLENLALGRLLELLTPTQSALLRAATLFALPVPPRVIAAVSPGGDAEEDLRRMVGLGLLEVYEDLHEPHEPALALNQMVLPLAGTLDESEQKRLAQLAVPVLFEEWGAEDGSAKRKYVQDYELTRLGLLAGDVRVLGSCGADALRLLENTFAYKCAADWASRIMAVLDAAEAPASVRLLRTAADRLMQVGRVAEARDLRLRALREIENGADIPASDRGLVAFDHGRALVQEGRIDEALKFFTQARALAPTRREQAIVIGEIARIRRNKGELDEALTLHEEEFAVYEELGDKRSRAITLDDIAWIRLHKGEIDEALALYQEALEVHQESGDKDLRAITLGSIARIVAAKGGVDEALALHQEELAVYEELGDKRSRAITLGDIARLRAAKGEIDEALALHQEELAVNEELGEPGGVANALWSIARLKLRKSRYQEATEHLKRSYALNLKLDHLDGICAVGLELGRLLCAGGQKEKGREILIHSRDGFLKLGWLDLARQVESLLDQYQ